MADRKSLFDISWQVDEPTYREDPGYSYSTLAKFNREGFAKIDSLFDRVSTPSLTFGSMVDTLLTDGEAAFNERFFVANFPAISASFTAFAILTPHKYVFLYLITSCIFSSSKAIFIINRNHLNIIFVFSY